MRLLVKLFVVVTALAGGLLASSPAWAAVQTTTWGMTAAPITAGQERNYISHPSDGKTVRDAVVVYNRTSSPLVVSLSVLGARYSGKTVVYTSPDQGLAARLHLAATKVTLGPHQSATVPVTIREAHGARTTQLAAIAGESTATSEGSVLVEQRLVVWVQSTPAVASAGGPDLSVAGPIAIGVLAVAGGLAVFEVQRRRRRLLSMAGV